MKKKVNLKIFVSIPLLAALLVILMLPVVFSSSMTDIVLNASDANLTITISSAETIYYSAYHVGSNFIYFNEIRASESSDEWLTFNITHTNKSYSGSDLPVISETKDSELWHITSSIDTVAATLRITGKCGSTKYIYNSALGTYTQSWTKPSCSGGMIDLSLNGIETGTNTLSSSIVTNGIASTLLRNGLAVILAIFILVVLMYPLTKIGENNWGIKNWIIYFVISIVTIFLVIILIQEIFNVTV